MKRYMFTTIIICGIIILSGTVKIQVSVSLKTESQINKQPIFSYTLHDPILIDSDDDFVTYGFPGSGTAGEPYIIENYNITTTTNEGIYIRETSKHFIIRNCSISATGEDGKGIHITDIASGTINIVNNIICNNGDYGLRIRYSDLVTISNNTISNNGRYGLTLSSSDSVTITNNTFSYNGNRGFDLWYCANAMISDNTFIENNNGLDLWYSSLVTISFNTFVNDGLNIHDNIDAFESWIVNDNTVNGKILGWYVNQESLSLTTPVYGQIFLLNCPNSVIRNQNLSNTTNGLYCRWCNNLIISDNSMNNNVFGLYLSSCDLSSITSNTFNNNNLYGLFIDDSSLPTINHNSFSNNGIAGLYSNQIWVSSPVILCFNTFNNDGMFISDSSGAGSETYEDWVVNENTVNGKILGWFVNQESLSLTTPIYGQLFLINCSNSVINNQNLNCTFIGLYCKWSNNLIISENRMNNNYYGLYLEDSNFPIIYNNILSNNDIFGLYLFRSHDSIVIYNAFIENYLGGSSQAFDCLGKNSTFSYNYWSDLTGPDDNADGIVDLPYIIQDNNIDSSPLTTLPSLVNLAPVILNIQHYPSSPSKNDIITISANVIDNIQVQSVTLYYRSDGGTWQNILMTVSVPTIYSVNFGPFSSKSTIEYYIVANDNNGNTVQSSIYSFIFEKTEKTNYTIFLLPLAFLFLLVVKRKRI